MRNIVFLDVDGVLNSLPYSKMVEESNYKMPELDINSIKILGEIVKEHNGFVVLSSTWRQIEEYDEYKMLKSMLAAEGIVIQDKTEIIGLNRPKEIYDWIKNKSQESDKYLILDDDFGPEEYKKYGLDKYLIHTFFFCSTYEEGGLQKRHIDEAKKIFFSQRVNRLR